MRSWIFSSKDIDNIIVASERLIWGFWDRELARNPKSKLLLNWRSFIRLYNNLNQGDIVFFQVAKTGSIHAVGMIKETYYDDQTPIWNKEITNNRVFFPWRVRFHFIIFSKEPFTVHFTEIKNYIDGYGIGELPSHEAQRILNKVNKQMNKAGIKFFYAI